MKNNVYPCKLQFYYIKVGFKGVNIICFRDAYIKTFVTSKDSDQPLQPLNIARVLVHSSLNSLEAVESSCDQ